MSEHRIFSFQFKNNRSQQEDRYLSLSTTIKGYRVSLLAVADGMGGYGSGDLAAEIAISELENMWKNYQNDIQIDNWNKHKANLQAVYFRINSKLRELVKSGEGSLGMGTTLTCALIIDGRMIVGSIGDSRCYVLTEGRIDQLTKDHSAIQEAIDSGISIDEINVGSNAITKSLNVNEVYYPDIYPFEKEYYNVDNKGILLSTDGMHGVLSEKVIYEVLIRSGKIDLSLKELAEYAINSGSTDNITIVLQIPDELIFKIFNERLYTNIRQTQKRNYLKKIVLFVFIVVSLSLLSRYAYNNNFDTILSNDLNIFINNEEINDSREIEDLNFMSKEALIDYVVIQKRNVSELQSKINSKSTEIDILKDINNKLIHESISIEDLTKIFNSILINRFDNNLIRTSLEFRNIQRFLFFYHESNCIEESMIISPIKISSSGYLNFEAIDTSYVWGKIQISIIDDRKSHSFFTNECFKIYIN